MEKIEEIRLSLIDSYTKSFKGKEPIASLYSDIEILMLTIDEDPEFFLSQYDQREIQMYNYLLNEMITEIRKRSTERKIVVGTEIRAGNRRPPPISVQQVNRNERNIKLVLPNFEISEDLNWPELAHLSAEPVLLDQRNITLDFDLRATDRRQTSPGGNIAPTIPPHSEIVADERSLEIELQKQNFNQPILESIDERILSTSLEMQLLRNSVDIEEPSTQSFLLPNDLLVEPNEPIRDLELQTSDAIRSNELPKTSEIPQFGNLVDVEEVLVTLPDSTLPLKRMDLPSTKELPTRQQIQYDELEVIIPEIPPEDPFVQEFRELFERRRREKAAVDYAERTTLRTKRPSVNLKYRDLTRSIAPLKPISDEGRVLRILPIFSRVVFPNLSNKIQNLLISTSNQEWYQRSLTDRTLNTEFSNFIVNKPQSTPETPYSGKQKPKKWTSALPVLEEDQIDVQRAPNVSEDQNQIIIKSKSAESHETPLTAKNVQKEITGWKLTAPKSPRPVLPNEIEPPPLPSTSIQNHIMEETSEIIEEVINVHSKRIYSNEHLKQRHAKRPKLTTEKVYPTSKVQNLTEDTVFQQYLKSWKKSFLLNANSIHYDVHFPVDLLRMLDFGTPVHHVLKEIVDNGDNQLNRFLPTTSSRKEASKRIKILLELRSQNLLDFIVQDGEVKGISIKY